VRLAHLYLASRSTALALTCLAGVAALMSLGLMVDDNEVIRSMLLTVAPVGVAAVVGASARNPFGEVEMVASASLARLRLGQIGLQIGLAGLTIALGASLTSSGQIAETLIRNGAGYAGLVMLGAWLFGAAASWVPAFAYGAVVLIADSAGVWTDRWWTWPTESAASDSALAFALMTLAAGMTALASQGARTSPPEVT
jgi:uncharacterized membrane protein